MLTYTLAASLALIRSCGHMQQAYKHIWTGPRMSGHYIMLELYFVLANEFNVLDLGFFDSCIIIM